MFYRTVENEDAKRYGGLRAETELDVVLKTLFSIVRQNCKFLTRIAFCYDYDYVL